MNINKTITPTPLPQTMLIVLSFLILSGLFRFIITILDLPRPVSSFSIWFILITPHIFSRRVTYTLTILCAIQMIIMIHLSSHSLNGIVSVSISSCIIALISEITFRFKTRYLNLTKDLNKARSRAEKADEAKSVFLANMSHEIRTPISGIIGVSDMLRNERLSPRQEELLNVITDSSDVLLHIINNILDYSKIEAGKLKLVNDPFSLDHLFTKVTRNMELLAMAKNIKLVKEIHGTLPRVVSGDKYRLRQVLTNLIGNAIKYTDVGQITLNINSSIGNNVLFLTIAVVDTGVGIPEKQIDSLFTPFEQGNGSYKKSTEGTGLGLAITRLLVEEMNGSIEVSSKINVGTRFCVKLPFPISSDAVPDKSADTGPYINMTENDDNFHSILLAEDNKVNQLYLSHFLEQEGYRLTVVENGKDAFELVKSEQFDSILMDIQMPVMSGLEAAERIRKHEYDRSLRRTPILALTASVTEDDRNQIHASGIDHFCPKPVDMRGLLATLKRVIDN